MCHDLCLYHPHQSFSDQLSAWSNKGSLRLKPMFLLGELPTFVKILRPLLSDEPLANVEASVVGPLLIILSFCEPFILFGLLFQSLEGFLLVLSLSGQILYTSESVASLLGYLPHELHNIFILDILHESNHGAMCEVLSSASSQGAGIMRQDGPQETYVSVDLYMKRGNLGSTDSSVIYEPMNLKGTFLTAVGEAGALPGGHGAPADAAAHARAHPLRRLEERVQLSTQPRVEVPLLGPQSPSHNRLPAVRGSRNFRIRLLPRGGPRESCGGSRGLDADRRRHVLPLPLPDQGPAVDLVADALLHHLPPVELQAGIRRMHQHRHELRRGLDAQQGGAHQRCIGVVLADVGAESHVLPELAGLLRAFGQLQGQPVSQPVREVRMRRRGDAGRTQQRRRKLRKPAVAAVHRGVHDHARVSGDGGTTGVARLLGAELVAAAARADGPAAALPDHHRVPCAADHAHRAAAHRGHLCRVRPLRHGCCGGGGAGSATGELLGVPGERLTHQHETRALTAAGAGVAPVAAAAVGRWTTTPAAAAAAGPFPGLPSAQAPGAAATDPQAAGGIAPGLRAANARALHQPQPDGHCDERQRSAFHAVPADDDAVGTNVDDRRTDGCVDAGTLFAGYGSRRLYGQLLPEGLDAPHAEPAATAPATDAARAAAATAAGPPKFGLFGNRSSGICCSGVPAPAAHGPNDIHFKF
nr:uncharacterized protein LOC126536053 isoform X5 [Dermacentor andersoni]